MDWTAILLPSANIGETFVRGTVMFLVIFAIMRVAGQREGGAHSLTDLLVVVLVAQAAAPGMAGHASAIADSLILIATIVGWSIALDVVAYRCPASGTCSSRGRGRSSSMARSTSARSVASS